MPACLAPHVAVAESVDDGESLGATLGQVNLGGGGAGWHIRRHRLDASVGGQIIDMPVGALVDSDVSRESVSQGSRTTACRPHVPIKTGLKGKRAEGPNRDSDGRDSHDQEITTSSVPKGLDGGRWYQAARLEMLHKRRGQHVTIHPAWVGMMARLSAPSQYACRIPKAQKVPSR